MSQLPLYTIHSSAPTRICDCGGWTDTWFAEYGRVFNIAIEPRAVVSIAAYPKANLTGRVMISAENFGDHYVRHLGTAWQKHPLIEAAIHLMGIPDHIDVEIKLFSEAPPGASLGTSAAMTVALIGALAILNDKPMSVHEAAYMAQRVETEVLGLQCGIQDQLSAAYGGISHIEMYDYPQATVSTIRPQDKILWELERRLLLVYLGQPHHSSQVHEQVIRHLEGAGRDEPRLARLRETALPAQHALLAGDFSLLGQIFSQNTEAQRALHPALVNHVAQDLIELGQRHQVLGWKVNGAGGNGGSLTLLLDGNRTRTRTLMAEIKKRPGCRIIRPKLAVDGLRRYIWRD